MASAHFGRFFQTLNFFIIYVECETAALLASNTTYPRISSPTPRPFFCYSLKAITSFLPSFANIARSARVVPPQTALFEALVVNSLFRPCSSLSSRLVWLTSAPRYLTPIPALFPPHLPPRLVLAYHRSVALLLQYHNGKTSTP